eukprot:TRINITY_DN1795_c1_g2_i1.p1 TRINITY_DN1795_c1_g2~~TRINITY_DN1795_c1_g2_i1.p1  ORF type:complete len:514 (+),score=126.67 TRINITY_DN1795_c1_g2_i1:1020-2561(+)
MNIKNYKGNIIPFSEIQKIKTFHKYKDPLEEAKVLIRFYQKQRNTGFASFKYDTIESLDRFYKQTVIGFKVIYSEIPELNCSLEIFKSKEDPENKNSDIWFFPELSKKQVTKKQYEAIDKLYRFEFTLNHNHVSQDILSICKFVSAKKHERTEFTFILSINGTLAYRWNCHVFKNTGGSRMRNGLDTLPSINGLLQALDNKHWIISALRIDDIPNDNDNNNNNDDVNKNIIHLNNTNNTNINNKKRPVPKMDDLLTDFEIKKLTYQFKNLSSDSMKDYEIPEELKNFIEENLVELNHDNNNPSSHDINKIYNSSDVENYLETLYNDQINSQINNSDLTSNSYNLFLKNRYDQVNNQNNISPHQCNNNPTNNHNDIVTKSNINSPTTTEMKSMENLYSNTVDVNSFLISEEDFPIDYEIYELDPLQKEKELQYNNTTPSFLYNSGNHNNNDQIDDLSDLYFGYDSTSSLPNKDSNNPENSVFKDPNFYFPDHSKLNNSNDCIFNSSDDFMRESE